MPSLGGDGRDFVSSARVSAFGTRKSYGFSEGPGVHVNNIAFNAANLSENVAVIGASGLLWTPTRKAFRTPIRVA